MQKNSFVNSVVIVTGAASGIGREVALQAAARGAAVMATDRNAAELEATKTMCEEKGLAIQTSLLDVSDKEAIVAFAKETTPALNGRRLILVNNAGVGLSSGSFAETALEDFEWLININLWGAICLTKAFYPYFIQQNEGHIVNLSSVFGLIGVATNAAYCTSKFGIRGFTESLRMELRGTGIHTTCVHPGGVKTNVVKNALLRGEWTTKEMHQKSIAGFERQARTTSESAARQILDAVENRKDRLIIGVDGRAIDFVSRLFPVRYTGMMHAQLKKAFGID